MEGTIVSYHELVNTLRKLEIDRSLPVIAHASLSAIGPIQGGTEALLGALLETFNGLMMPAFTYQTMVTPETGPPDNGLTYGSGQEQNAVAEFFHPDLPVDPRMGLLVELLRGHPKALRSMHPILSFGGVGVESAIQSQSLAEPLAPVRVLEDKQGWAILLGIGHTANTSLHYAEQLAGRKQFLRWALSPSGVIECPGFPGCSSGFEMAATRLRPITRRVQIGNARVQAFPLVEMICIVKEWIAADPLALLCDRSSCECCRTVRQQVVG